MSVRAKFRVNKIERTSHMRRTGKNDKGADTYEPCELHTIVMSPVYSSDPESENAKFWDASPSGEIRLGTVNEQAWSQFELGRDYYIDFIPADT